jgi:hypothetical protein
MLLQILLLGMQKLKDGRKKDKKIWQAGHQDLYDRLLNVDLNLIC